MHLTFGIDIDGTISKDVPLFKKIISEIKNSGHAVYIVTGRKEFTKDIEYISRFGVSILFCGDRLKKDFVESKGISIDIWIDDMPGTIERCRKLEECSDDELISAGDVW